MEIAVTKVNPPPSVVTPVERPAVQANVAPADPAPDVPPATRQVQTQEAIAEQVSRFLQTSARNLEFQVQGDAAAPVIIVRDGEGNVVRRIPGEAALQMLRLANAQSGTLVNSVA